MWAVSQERYRAQEFTLVSVFCLFDSRQENFSVTASPPFFFWENDNDY